MGLWLLQECKRQLDADGSKLSYADLDMLAAQSAPFRSIINPNDPVFFGSGGMIQKIRHACEETSAGSGNTAKLTRCIKESLAFAYRNTLQKIEEAIGASIPHVHILGGGAQSELLNRFEPRP